MAGAHNSLLKKIRDSQGDQKVFDVGCPCHVAHLCAGKGAKELSVNVEDFVIDTYYHFRRRVKRNAQLRDFMELNNNEVRKVIKHVSTRWSSLGRCIERTLKQWDLFKVIFSCFDLQDDLEAEDQTNDNTKREKRLVKAFKDPITKLYAMFVQSVIPIFDSFNTFLQSEAPLIHILHQCTIRLYRLLLSRFICPQVISSSRDLTSIDLDNAEFQKSDNEIFIGAMTKQYARDTDIVGTSQYKKFLKECKKFFITCTKYLKKSMPVLQNEVIKSLRLPERYQASTDELEVTTSRFPNVRATTI